MNTNNKEVGSYYTLKYAVSTPNETKITADKNIREKHYLKMFDTTKYIRDGNLKWKETMEDC